MLSLHVKHDDVEQFIERHLSLEINDKEYNALNHCGIYLVSKGRISQITLIPPSKIREIQEKNKLAEQRGFHVALIPCQNIIPNIYQPQANKKYVRVKSKTRLRENLYKYFNRK